MAGLDGLLLAGAIWLIDLRGLRRWAEPFVTIGLNPISLYMASELIDISLSASGWRKPLYEAVFLPLTADPYVASLLYALANVAVIYGIAWVMRRRGLVVSV
jgi:predicted acyltransferase